MTGTSNRRCREDEAILNKALPNGKKGIIFDTRDLNTAKNAVYKGKLLLIHLGVDIDSKMRPKVRWWL